MSTVTNALDVLRDVFGYPAFRGAQAEIIQHIQQGGDALVLMPTGGGKSLCFQIPALLRPGCAVVVSPLIALMQDQVDALLLAGVRAPQRLAGLVAWSGYLPKVDMQVALGGELTVPSTGDQTMLRRAEGVVTLNQNIWDFGTTINDIKRARATYRSAQWGTRERIEAISYEISASYLTMLERTKLIGLTESEIAATQKILEKSGLSLDDIDLIEINEAFAAVSLASTQELGVDPDKVNRSGGAIAMGHPIGMSGARITLHAALELARRGSGYAAAALCGAGGQGDALILRR